MWTDFPGSVGNGVQTRVVGADVSFMGKGPGG